MTRRQKAATITAAVLCAAALSSCSTSSPAASPPPVAATLSPTSTPAPAPAAPITPETPAVTAIPAAPDAATSDGEGPALPSGPLDQAGSDAAAAIATAFMRAYSQTTLSKADWFAGIKGFLTDYAVTEYQYNDPAMMPALAVTAVPALEPGATLTAATVDTPTSIGTYQVQLLRPTGVGPWAVSRAVPPPGQN